MSTRTLRSISQANKCGECSDPATHSTTDSQQTTEGFVETKPRFGCKGHKVTPLVILIDGTKIPFEQYTVQ